MIDEEVGGQVNKSDDKNKKKKYICTKKSQIQKYSIALFPLLSRRKFE